MTWSGGTYTRSDGTTGCATDEANSIGILSTKMDDRLNELTTGVNTCLTKDGQNAATANLPMGGFKHTNVADATADTHYASYGQVKTNFPRIYGRSIASANVVGTTSETTLCTFTMTGGDMGTTRKARLDLFGYFNNNTGSDKTFRFRLKFGTTTIHDYTFTAVTNGSSRFFKVIFEVSNSSSASAQVSYANIEAGSPAAGTTGIATFTTVANYNTSAENTATDKAISVSIEMNSTSCQTVAAYSTVELI